MTDKPYRPRLGGRYEKDKDTGKATRVEGTEQPGAGAPVKPAPAKTDKPAAKPRKEA